MRSSAVRAAIVALVLGAAGAGCGGGEDRGAPAAAENDVRFTREDGSEMGFAPSLRAWCAPFDEDNPDVPAVHVVGGALPVSDQPEPFWVLSAVRPDIEREPEVTLPNEFVYTEPRGVAVFALDTERRNNELSSAEEEASGVVRVELEGCDAGDEVRVEFEDVVLGSELHLLPTVNADGVAVAEIGEAPSRIGP